MTCLLDVNLLLALLWENHEQHEPARRWFQSVTEFATCPVGQLGFVRISSHPMLGYGLTPEQAFAVLRRLLADARHRFVPDNVSCDDRVLLTERITGPNQVTDHYLAALARRHGMTVATFDEPLSRAFPGEPGLITLVR